MSTFKFGDIKRGAYLPLYARLQDMLMLPIALQSDPSFDPTQGILPYPQILSIGAPAGHEITDFCWAFSKDHQCQYFEVNWHEFFHTPGTFLHKLRLEIEASFNIPKIPVINSILIPANQKSAESGIEANKQNNTGKESKKELESTKASKESEPLILQELSKEKESDNKGNVIKPPLQLQIFLISFDKLLEITRKLENAQFLEGHLITSHSLILELCDLLAGITWPPNSLCLIVYNEQNPLLIEPHQFDFNMSLPLPDVDARKIYFEQLFSVIPGVNLDFEHLALHSKNWNFAEIRIFIRNCLYLWNSTHPLQKVSPIKEQLSMQFLIEQIEKIEVKHPIDQETVQGKAIKILDRSELGEISQAESSSNSYFGALTADFEDQLYQLAAGKNYDSLVLILDKLTKGIILQSNERRIIADYAFMIREDPQKALHKLNQMKFKLDKITPLKNLTKSKQSSSSELEKSPDNFDSK